MFLILSASSARAIQYDRWADEILTIADDVSGDSVQRLGKDGSTERVVDHENIQRSRLRCDSRKWLLSKLLPDRFGERTTTAVTGPNGGAIKTECSYAALRHLSREAKAERRQVRTLIRELRHLIDSSE
jgi:hypothetical protein